MQVRASPLVRPFHERFHVGMAITCKNATRSKVIGLQNFSCVNAFVEIVMLSLRSIWRTADVKAAIMRVHARSFGTDVPQDDVKTKVPQDGASPRTAFSNSPNVLAEQRSVAATSGS